MRILEIAVNLETDFYEDHTSGLNEENRHLCGRLNQTTTLTSIEDTLLQLPYANLLCGCQTELQICFPIFINSVMLGSLLNQRRIIEYSDRKVDLELLSCYLHTFFFPQTKFSLPYITPSHPATPESAELSPVFTTDHKVGAHIVSVTPGLRHHGRKLSSFPEMTLYNSSSR